MSKALVDALNDLFDARLTEHGLLEESEAPKKPAAGKTAGKKKATADETDDDEVTHDSLSELAKAAAKVSGKPAVIKALAKLKVKQISALKESQFAAAQKALSALAEAEDSDGDDDEGDPFD